MAPWSNTVYVFVSEEGPPTEKDKIPITYVSLRAKGYPEDVRIKKGTEVTFICEVGFAERLPWVGYFKYKIYVNGKVMKETTATVSSGRESTTLVFPIKFNETGTFKVNVWTEDYIKKWY